MSVKIFKGVISPDHMGKTFGIGDLAGIERLTFMERDAIKGKAFHVAAHVIGAGFVPQEDWHYAVAHAHDFDEINMFVSSGGGLKYRVECDGIVEEISSPSLIYIPAGTRHRCEAIEGTGIFICIYLDQDGKKQDKNRTPHP